MDNWGAAETSLKKDPRDGSAAELNPAGVFDGFSLKYNKLKSREMNEG